jgi:hypothetical protein
MARKPKLNIVKRVRKGDVPSYSDFRRLTPDENEREGFTRKARRYVLKSVRRLTKRTPTISARQHETLRTQEEYGFAKPEIATKAREHGSYKTGRAAETAEKGRNKAFEKKQYREIEQAARTGKRISEHSGAGAIKGGQSFKARAWHADEIAELRARKLAGAELTQAEFSMLMDYAEWSKDPKRGILRQSPGSFNPRITPQ